MSADDFMVGLRTHAGVLSELAASDGETVYLRDGYAQMVSDDIRAAMEHITQIEAKVARLESRGIHDMQHTIEELESQVRRLESKLERVRGLPDKWINKQGDYATKRAECECADELRAALTEETP